MEDCWYDPLKTFKYVMSSDDSISWKGNSESSCPQFVSQSNHLSSKAHKKNAWTIPVWHSDWLAWHGHAHAGQIAPFCYICNADSS